MPVGGQATTARACPEPDGKSVGYHARQAGHVTATPKVRAPTAHKRGRLPQQKPPFVPNWKQKSRLHVGRRAGVGCAPGTRKGLSSGVALSGMSLNRIAGKQRMCQH